MKNLRPLSAAFVLTLALTMPAFAGDIHTMVAAPPPPAPASITTEGVISTGVAGQDSTGSGEASAGDSIAGLALSLLQSVLSLL